MRYVSPEIADFRNPLGLPAGSVRALLTMMVVAVVVVQTVQGKELSKEFLWVETLMIVLAQYFTSRRFINLPPEALARLEEEGVLEKEPHPLYLPRNTIRAVILLSFVGLGVYLYREGRLINAKGEIVDRQAVTILILVFAYLSGVLVRGLGSWLFRGRGGRPVRWWADLKAVIALAGMAFAAVMTLVDRQDLLPDAARHLALSAALFYFGSR